MTTASDDDARANRRWLIGIGITLAFGIFGAVMAILGYSSKSTEPAAGPAATAAADAPAATPGGGGGGEGPAPRGHGKGKKQD